MATFSLILVIVTLVILGIVWALESLWAKKRQQKLLTLKHNRMVRR